VSIARRSELEQRGIETKALETCNPGGSIKLRDRAVGDQCGGIRFSVRGEEMQLTHSLLRDSLMALVFSLITPKNFPVMELKIPCSCS
jgi:hypothetical protein